jgi:hypothetical protein
MPANRQLSRGQAGRNFIQEQQFAAGRERPCQFEAFQLYRVEVFRHNTRDRGNSTNSNTR